MNAVHDELTVARPSEAMMERPLRPRGPLARAFSTCATKTGKHIIQQVYYMSIKHVARGIENINCENCDPPWNLAKTFSFTAAVMIKSPSQQ